MLRTLGDRENPALLLLHGIGMGHRLWRRQIDRFQATHFVIAPDLAGLTGPASPHRTDIVEIAGSLERALRGLAIDRFSLCGISAGASVALALALRMGGNIRHLVLSAPQARAPRLALGLQIALCSAMPERMLLSLAKRIYGNDPDIAAAAGADLAECGKAGLLDAMRALWRLDLRKQLSSITAPTWVFCGSRDGANLPAAQDIAAAIPRAVLRIEPDDGHRWNLQNPTRFNTALADVLTTAR
jgi:pimeloyl-ACP methyl ester carboxylesterase